MTDEEAIRTVTELYESERKEERKMKEKELNKKVEELKKETNAIAERIAALSEESRRLADEMDEVMNEYGEKGEVPRRVISQALMINYGAYELRHLADKVVKEIDEN